MYNPETTGHETSINGSIEAVNKDIETLSDTTSVEENGTSDHRSANNSVTLKKEVWINKP